MTQILNMLNHPNTKHAVIYIISIVAVGFAVLLIKLWREEKS